MCKNLKCVKCNEKMVKTPNTTSLSIYSGSESVIVDTYVCEKCGYIEQYAKINSK